MTDKQPMRRRRFLAATAGAAVLAGCPGGNESVEDWLTYVPTTPRLIVKQWVAAVDDGAAASFVRRLVSEGSITVREGNIPQEVSDGDITTAPVRVGDAVYDFERRKASTATYRSYRITVLYNYEHDGPKSISQNPDPDEAVAFDELPPVDRRVLADAFPIPNETRESMRERGVTPGLPGDTDSAFSTELEATYRTTNLSRSKLVEPMATSVEYDGTVYEVLVEFEAERTSAIHRFSVANRWTLEEFADRLVAAHAVPTDAFTEAQRRVLAEVVEGGNYPVAPDDDAAQALIETLKDHPDAEVAFQGPGPISSPTFYPWAETTWLVRYRGTSYFIQWYRKTMD